MKTARANLFIASFIVFDFLSQFNIEDESIRIYYIHGCRRAQENRPEDCREGYEAQKGISAPFALSLFTVVLLRNLTVGVSSWMLYANVL